MLYIRPAVFALQGFTTIIQVGEPGMRVLIVDDEETTSEGLRDLLPWDDLGVNHIYTASDGVEGLELAREIKPDIIITDIRMPKMDGIKYIENIKSMYYDSRVIFMSAYSDKDYLMSAIKLNVTSYVEKPIDLKEMTSAVKAAVESMNKERRSMELISHSVAISLTEADIDLSEAVESIGSIKPDFLRLSKYCTLIIRADLTREEISKRADLIDELDKILNTSFSSVISAKMDEKGMIVHVSDNIVTNQTEMKRTVHRLISDISQRLSLNNGIFAAVGRHVTEISDIWLSYNTALEASDLFFYTGYGSVVFHEDLTRHETLPGEHYTDIIEQSLRFNDIIAAETALQKLYIQLRHQKCADINSVRNTCFKIALDISMMSTKRMLPTGNEDSSDFIWKSIAEKETLNEIYAYLQQKMEVFFSCINDVPARKPIYSIIMYLEKNYGRKSISIQEIADSVFLTSAYVCNLFKKETGKTIIQYLNDYRIEKAKTLLKSNELKLADVADRVGFSDVNYFIKVFKRTTKTTPSEYRNKLLI
jgi:two-component system response regulator YesN